MIFSSAPILPHLPCAAADFSPNLALHGLAWVFLGADGMQPEGSKGLECSLHKN
jgi:hypothetical protein